MKLEEITNFEKIAAQLSSFHNEITILAKKQPDGAINEFKLKFINQVLVKSNQILGDKNKPFDDFTEFNADNMPTNSDVALIIGQYINCMDEYKSDHIVRSGPFWYWVINTKRTEIQTSAPVKLGK